MEDSEDVQGKESQGDGDARQREGEEREGEWEATQVVFVHHPPPRRLRSLIKKMWVRKSTRSIAKEVKTIDIATSLTRPSSSNVETVVLEP